MVRLTALERHLAARAMVVVMDRVQPPVARQMVPSMDLARHLVVQRMVQRMVRLTVRLTVLPQHLVVRAMVVVTALARHLAARAMVVVTVQVPQLVVRRAAIALERTMPTMAVVLLTLI